MVITESIAFIAFIYAAVLAFLRHKETKKEVNLWCLITLALFLFSLISLISIFEYSLSDIMNHAFKQLKITFMLIGSTVLFSTLCVYHMCCIKCKGKDKLFY